VNTGHCPETSRDANGYNRYYRIKVLLNVAEVWVFSLRYTVPKLNEWGRLYDYVVFRQSLPNWVGFVISWIRR